MTPDLDVQARAVVAGFGSESFSTRDFIEAFKSRFPSGWEAIVAKYGAGGRGGGRHYTAFVRMGQILKTLAQRGELRTLPYVGDVPEDWGSPVIRFWEATPKSDVKARLSSSSPQEGAVFPDEIVNAAEIFEGARKRIEVNAYERDARARKICIKRWGTVCAACKFDFGVVYGDRGVGFIHVHHLVPLAQVGGKYQLNPERDLRPVCPNCHAMLHRTPLFTIEELAALISRQSGT